MLISVKLENWMSFRDEVTFSMVAGRERQHGERIPHFRKYKTKVLPIAAIYGGNASGKSNFFKAISFVQEFVLGGTRPDELIPVQQFLLNSETALRPSHFVFELMVNETIYEFSFSATKNAVVEEKLVEIGTAHEREFYHRQNGNIKLNNIPPKYKDFIQYVTRGTRENQLFLTNSVFQNIDTFRHVYDWFKNTLRLIAPNAHYIPIKQFYVENNPLYGFMNEMLQSLDTGISYLNVEKITLDNLPISAEFQKNVKKDTAVSLISNSVGVKRIANKLVAYHSTADGEYVKFDMHQESDGSIRIIDLLPAFVDISSNAVNRVYIIDEIDRSLHTLLTRKLIETYLASCSAETRAQMLLTTHDVLLIDQCLLRRDEIWVAERDNTGNSTLIPFSDYKNIRYDKDIRKSYLLGRMGGIPRILLDGTFNADAVKKED